MALLPNLPEEHRTLAQTKSNKQLVRVSGWFSQVLSFTTIVPNESPVIWHLLLGATGCSWEIPTKTARCGDLTYCVVRGHTSEAANYKFAATWTFARRWCPAINVLFRRGCLKLSDKVDVVSPFSILVIGCHRGWRILIPHDDQVILFPHEDNCIQGIFHMPPWPNFPPWRPCLDSQLPSNAELSLLCHNDESGRTLRLRTTSFMSGKHPQLPSHSLDFSPSVSAAPQGLLDRSLGSFTPKNGSCLCRS